jgi:hypothetical protein
MKSLLRIFFGSCIYRYFLAVLWIRNFSLRIRIRLFNEFRIRILLVKSSGFGKDLFPDEI